MMVIMSTYTAVLTANAVSETPYITLTGYKDNKVGTTTFNSFVTFPLIFKIFLLYYYEKFTLSGGSFFNKFGIVQCFNSVFIPLMLHLFHHDLDNFREGYPIRRRISALIIIMSS